MKITPSETEIEVVGDRAVSAIAPIAKFGLVFCLVTAVVGATALIAAVWWCISAIINLF